MRLYKAILPVKLSKGSIIDFETTGLDVFSSDIISAAIIAGNQLIILQRETQDKEVFYSNLKARLKRLPKPFIAYNAEFEKKFMKHRLEFDPKIMLDPFEYLKEKAERKGLKWPKLDELSPVPKYYFNEHAVHSRTIPILWRKYQQTKNNSLLGMIIYHVKEDVLQLLNVWLHFYREVTKKEL